MRARTARRATSRSSQSRREPGLPWTKTTASAESTGPADETGTLSPSTTMRVGATAAGSGGPSTCAPAGRSTARGFPTREVDSNRAADESCELGIGRPDRSRAEGMEARVHRFVLGRRREQQPLKRTETAPRGVVGREQEVAEQLAPMTFAIALDPGIDPCVRRIAVQRLRELIGQPFARLEGPPATDAPCRIGRDGRVAHEGESRTTGRPHCVRHLELPENLRDALPLRKIWRTGQPSEVVLEVRLDVPLEPRHAVPRLEGRHQRDAVVLREGVRDIGIEHPEQRPVARHERQVAVIREVAEAVVRLHAGRYSGHPGDLGATSVRPDDHASRDLPLVPLAVDHANSRRPSVGSHERGGPLPQHQLDARESRPRALASSDRAFDAECHSRTADADSRLQAADGSSHTASRRLRRCGLHPRPRSAPPARAARSSASHSAG